MATGMVASVTWMHSLAAWETHLNKSYIAGLSLFEALHNGTAPHDGLVITPLTAADSKLASAGMFRKLDSVSSAAFITQFSLATTSIDGGTINKLALAVVSPDLRYEIAGLSDLSEQGLGAKLAELTRQLATYCSEPRLFVQYGDALWQEVDGIAIWGCAAAPTDWRVAAALLAAVALAVLVTVILGTSAAFTGFAGALGNHGLLRQQSNFPLSGPTELRMMIDSVNSYIESEKESLRKRALFLSGVSHDLGTPATRLRLRADGVADHDLRLKMNNDIDQMTCMIESVLAYTQSEVALEDVRKISLASLVEAVVDDYQDQGHPVIFTQPDAWGVTAQTILFPKFRKKKMPVLAHHPGIAVTARPLSIQRGLTNLIDNALKYGRKASVSLEFNSAVAKIHIDDNGGKISVEELRTLVAPFSRGSNAQSADGTGIGLAICTTIAEQHGGTLTFEAVSSGTRATLTIPR